MQAKIQGRESREEREEKNISSNFYGRSQPLLTQSPKKRSTSLTHMAITICSSPTTLPNVSFPSLPTISSLKSPPPLTLSSPASFSSSSLKFGLSLASDNALVIATTTAEALALASAAAEAARDAATSKMDIGDVSCGQERDNYGLENMEGMRRRKKRRKRRKGEYLELGKDINSEDDDEEILFNSANCLCLSRREEAEYALCLQERSRLEAVRMRITEARDPSLALNQWAESVGMKQRSLDRKLCNGRESRERICRIYKRLVVSIATGYQGKGLSLQDLIQEGSIGLLRGVQRFDPERGYKLSTYVYWWIRQAIIRAIENKSRVIRLPGSMCEMLAKIAQANNVLSRRLQRLPTYDEIAETLNVQVSTVRLVLERNRPPTSLDRAATNRGCMTLQEIIPGPEETTPETMVKKQLKKQMVEKLLKTLSEREANILRLHFGLNGDTPRSCEEIGRLLKLSRERVRQINGIALSKLWQTSIVQNLKTHMI